jgi:hypothetical protein
MDLEKSSDRGKAIETKNNGKAKKDIYRQLCEKYHLDPATDHLPHISSQKLRAENTDHPVESRKEAPSLPDDQYHQAMLSRDNEKILFTNIQIVETIDKGNSIIANENFEARDVIFPFIGELVPLDEATDKSLQITDDFCIESTAGFDNNLNHSCNPNCYIDFTNRNQPVLVALRDIKKGEELSFNYNATDYDLYDPRCTCSFHCNCGAPNCLEEIKGYKYLTPEQKREISPYLAPYLRKIYEEEFREHE